MDDLKTKNISENDSENLSENKLKNNSEKQSENTPKDIIEKRPNWIKVKSSTLQEDFKETLDVIKSLNVNTVCEEALCPNISECWKNKTATFLIMGDTCTRNCGFCGVKTGFPPNIKKEEAKNIANAVNKLDIKYVVITSVTRDDLPDGGANHFANVINEIKSINPDSKIEILTPDFKGSEKSIQIVTDAKPDVFAHNIEIVKKLHKLVKRPPSSYDLSLNFLKTIKRISPSIITKTGMMVGIGENKNDVFELIDDIASINVDILTIGQYLTPSTTHYPIFRYVTLEEFQEYKEYGESKGIKSVISGPLVRSSYKANEVYNMLCIGR